MAERSTADWLESVRWDYDPEQEAPSPLVAAERYFREFPWEPPELMATAATRAASERPAFRAEAAESRPRAAAGEGDGAEQAMADQAGSSPE